MARITQLARLQVSWISCHLWINDWVLFEMIDDNSLRDSLSEKPLKTQRDHGADEKVGFCWPEPRAAVCAALWEHGAPRLLLVQTRKIRVKYWWNNSCKKVSVFQESLWGWCLCVVHVSCFVLLVWDSAAASEKVWDHLQHLSAKVKQNSSQQIYFSSFICKRVTFYKVWYFA